MKRLRIYEIFIIAIAAILIAAIGLPGLAFLHVPRGIAFGISFCGATHVDSE